MALKDKIYVAAVLTSPKNGQASLEKISDYMINFVSAINRADLNCT